MIYGAEAAAVRRRGAEQRRHTYDVAGSETMKCFTCIAKNRLGNGTFFPSFFGANTFAPKSIYLIVFFIGGPGWR